MAKCPVQPIQHKTTYVIAMACLFSWKTVYVQTRLTGSHFDKTSVTDKCIVSYDESENYNDHHTDDKITIHINVILTKFAYEDYIPVRLHKITSLTIPVRNFFMY
jgi:hypothetical protein